MITYINIIKIDECCNINNKVLLLFNSKPSNKKWVSFLKKKMFGLVGLVQSFFFFSLKIYI